MLFECRRTLLVILFFSFLSLTNSQTQKVISTDGVEIAYSVSGEGETVLVFIHGWSCDKSYWKYQAEPFSKKYKIVTVDLAGHGESGLNRENFTIEKFGEDVASVVNKNNFSKVILIGHSMGGSVIIEAAKILKEKVIGLIGVDTYQSFEDNWTAEQKESYLKTFEPDFKTAAMGFVKSMFPKNADSLLVNTVTEDMSSAPPQVALSAMRSLFFYDPVPVLKEIQPFIYSINCDMYPVAAEQNSKLLNFYRLKIMENVGHFIMMEKPEQFNLYLEDAIQELLNNKK